MEFKITMELSELIRARRELKGIPRTTLAKMAGISPNSMVKYELSLLDGGKIPGAENLAKICELLEIDPRDAFDMINRGVLLKADKDNLSSDPDTPPKTQFRFAHHFRSDDEWHKMKLTVTDMESLDQTLMSFMAEQHYMDQRLERIEKMLLKLAGEKQNGPDQSDPSRPENTSNNPEAVGAASTNQTKGSD